MGMAFSESGLGVSRGPGTFESVGQSRVKVPYLFGRMSAGTGSP